MYTNCCIYFNFRNVSYRYKLIPKNFGPCLKETFFFKICISIFSSYFDPNYFASKIFIYYSEYTLFLSSTFCPKILSRRDISIFLGVWVQFYKSLKFKEGFSCVEIDYRVHKNLKFSEAKLTVFPNAFQGVGEK